MKETEKQKAFRYKEISKRVQAIKQELLDLQSEITQLDNDK